MRRPWSDELIPSSALFSSNSKIFKLEKFCLLASLCGTTTFEAHWAFYFFLRFFSPKKSSLFGKSLRRFLCVIEWVSTAVQKILVWKSTLLESRKFLIVSLPFSSLSCTQVIELELRCWGYCSCDELLSNFLLTGELALIENKVQKGNIFFWKMHIVLPCSTVNSLESSLAWNDNKGLE